MKSVCLFFYILIAIICPLFFLDLSMITCQKKKDLSMINISSMFFVYQWLICLKYFYIFQ